MASGKMIPSARTAYSRADDETGGVRRLIEDHLPLVARLVNRLRASIGEHLSWDDAIGAGTLGLVEAAHRFDPSRGVSFETFAYRRIRGAVVDWLRQNDPLGKSARERLAAVRRCAAEFRARNGRKPRIGELAEMTSMSENEVLRSLSYEKWDRVRSLDQNVEGEDGEGNVLSELIASDSQTPPEKLEWKERVERLTQAIHELPEREKQIIVMYYYEELYMAEMARILGISEARVSQLHTRAIYNLSRKLEKA